MPKSINDILNRKQQDFEAKKMGGKNAYKFKGGVTTIRILPSWRTDDATFFHDFGQTFIKDMDGKVMAVIGDRKLTYGDDDVVRRLIQGAMGDAVTDAQRAHYKEMLAKPRVLVNALILDDKEVDPNVPQIVDFSETQFDQIINQVKLNEIAEEFLDLTNGYNLKVSKRGTGFNTEYNFTFDRKSSAVSASVMDNIIDIDAFIRSKFLETERAVNAIKAITTGSTLSAPKAISYGGGDAETVEAQYDVIEDARNPAPWEETSVSENATDADIDKYFSE